MYIYNLLPFYKKKGVNRRIKLVERVKENITQYVIRRVSCYHLLASLLGASPPRRVYLYLEKAYFLICVLRKKRFHDRYFLIITTFFLKEIEFKKRGR